MENNNDKVKEYLNSSQIRKLIKEYNTQIATILEWSDKQNGRQETQNTPDTPDSKKAILIAWPSWSGKDTICKWLNQHFPNATNIIRHTNRPLRPWEKEGIEYHFHSNDIPQINWLHIEQVIGQNNTLYDYVYPQIESKEINSVAISVIPVDGITEIIEHFQKQQMKTYAYFILPQSWESFISRYIKRDNNVKIEELQARLTNGINEMKKIISLPENIKHYMKILQNFDSDQWPIQLLEKILSDINKYTT